MKTVLLTIISFYQRAVSPLTPASCRFHPTCSEYARQAVGRFGAFKGGGLAMRRIFRCHPFGSRGYDPVPVLPAQPNAPTQDICAAVAPQSMNPGERAPSEGTP